MLGAPNEEDLRTVRAIADHDRHSCASRRRHVQQLPRRRVRGVDHARRHALADDTHRRQGDVVALVRVGSHTTRLARTPPFSGADHNAHARPYGVRDTRA